MKMDLCLRHPKIEDYLQKKHTPIGAVLIKKGC